MAVTTAPLFGTNQKVVVSTESSTQVVRATDKRLTFTVNLGPAHTLQQFTPEQQLAESAGSYWQSTVRFSTGGGP